MYSASARSPTSRAAGELGSTFFVDGEPLGRPWREASADRAGEARRSLSARP